MANGHSSGHMASAAAANPWSRVQPRPKQRPDPCDDNCTPRCPACGGLKCICRPRFFPGQLLTDRELNGLEQYVVDKNRLHNSYLHGWGVACGLEVVCDDCDAGHVVVRDGYALSPCGDDIVVCADQSVDICALINACEPRDPNCEDPYDAPPRDCTGGVKKWVLAVCYDERPVRGITAQLGAGDSPGHGRCACGGSGSCGCSASGSGTGSGSSRGSCGSGCGCSGGSQGCSCSGSATKTTGSGRGYKPQCEPTQVCEGYRFIAYPAPKERQLDASGIRGQGSGDLIWSWLFANRSRFGPLIERVLCCVTKAMELRQNIREGVAINSTAAAAVYVEYAEALADFAADFAIHGCAFVGRTKELRDEAGLYKRSAPRNLTAAARRADLSDRIRVLDETWMEIVSECFCSALLPGCPTPPSTNCVPLAVVTISDDDCRVIDICNWSERKLLITWPTISYWLSWLPWRLVWKWILDMCCGSERNPGAYRLLTLMSGFIFSQGKAGAAGTASVASAAVGKEAAMMVGTVGPAQAASVDPLTAAFESDNLLTHMLGDFERFRREGAQTTDQPPWVGLVAQLADASFLTTPPVDDPKVVELTRRLDVAETKLRTQATKLAALSKKGGK